MRAVLILYLALVASSPGDGDSALVSRMQKVMGRFPGELRGGSLEVQVSEEVDCGDYLRRLISYQSEPNNRVPAYLLIPKAALIPSAKPVPGVLCLHPTNIELGAGVAVGLGGTANRAYAMELAKRGFVTLAPHYPTMGGYNPDLDKLGYQSGTMKAIVDNVRGIDLLESLPFVKKGSFGAIGHSLGGHNAIFSAMFEPRLRVIVSSCGFDSFTDYYGGDPRMWEGGKGWTQKRYMPRLADYAGRLDQIPFDFRDLIKGLAPRVVLINAPIGDSNFQWRSVDRIVTAARPAYNEQGVEGHLEVMHPDCSHDFPESARERAYQLLENHLQ